MTDRIYFRFRIDYEKMEIIFATEELLIDREIIHFKFLKNPFAFIITINSCRCRPCQQDN